MKWVVLLFLSFSSSWSLSLLCAAPSSLCPACVAPSDSAKQKKTILHLTFHKGCANAFATIAEKCGYSVTTWQVNMLPPLFFDGVTANGNELYNVTHERAERAWKKHRDFFHQFDLVCVSDTAPLSRLFLQNGFTKPLLIWICNRFDYCDERFLNPPFPDPEYYQLFAKAAQMPNVRVVGYTRFETYYTKQKGVDVGDRCIPPCVEPHNRREPVRATKEQFLLPPYHNEAIFMDLQSHLQSYGISCRCGRYEGPSDMATYRAVICLPYSWSNLALFEGIALGVPFFIPSRNFFTELAYEPNYFFPNLWMLLSHDLIDLTEWYDPSREEAFIFFDSWEDLAEKVRTTDYASQRKKVLAYAVRFYDETMRQWRALFRELLP